jgi:hypothetical protein
LLSISEDAVKQLNNGANPEVTAQTWIAKAISIGLALHEAAALKVAGLTTCERTA